MKAIVEIQYEGDSRFKKWAKVLKSVDQSKSNGYAFQGDFINSGKAELEIGTYILFYGEKGSMKYHDPMVSVQKVTENGLEEMYRKEDLDRHWALDVRDEIAKIINEMKKESPLAKYSNEELMEEMQNRGYVVYKEE
jgi:hypothetical protein